MTEATIANEVDDDVRAPLVSIINGEAARRDDSLGIVAFHQGRGVMSSHSLTNFIRKSYY